MTTSKGRDSNNNGDNMDSSLIDPSLLAHLSKEERQEALAAAAAAKRAEERAEQRALEKAMAQRAAQRQKEQPTGKVVGINNNLSASVSNNSKNNSKIVFVSKKKRQALKEEAAAESGKEPPHKQQKRAAANGSAATNGATGSRSHVLQDQHHASHNLSQAQLASIKKSYLGKTSMAATEDERNAELEQQRRRKQQSRNKKKSAFKFEWDNSEDTFDGGDDLYSGSLVVSSRGGNRRNNKQKPQDDNVSTVQSCLTKPLDKMTPRDWRIFRENYNITVKGGKTPPPLRSFAESPNGIPTLHSALLDAIANVLNYKQPSPIQRQAIPIGLQRRDLIGIAETGSGKTAAFGIPLCHYLLHLNQTVLERVADEGPLALVMAPTRELAIQINEEMAKLLSRQSQITSYCVVGGQPIQQQAMKLRQGVHIVVGTPGRINDCVEMAYLVLNQCCYIVMDEADRMIDLGFAPQMEQILNAMGGLLKSEDETLTYKQEEEDLKTDGGLPRHRLTAMFSATMPPEVERLAKQYLRHPAVVSIGDENSGKNARITQRIMFLSSPSQKEKALRELLSAQGRHNDKVIVFVNEKKHADGVGRMVERITGRRSVVLHGGKSQEQREENLKEFRRGGGTVLVATDVAGRGLDIPNVTHVINYDLPSRSIDNYSHRIGRTGRAGKEGLATSLLTEEDTTIMAPLKAYLESTGNKVPERLARHPAANAGMVEGNRHIT